MERRKRVGRGRKRREGRGERRGRGRKVMGRGRRGREGRKGEGQMMRVEWRKEGELKGREEMERLEMKR